MASRRNKNKETFIDSEIKNLSPEEWEELYLRLRYFTFGRYKRLTKASILEDLIHDSIVKVKRGKRHRPANVPIFNFICGIITSDTSHYFEKETIRTKHKNNLTVSILRDPEEIHKSRLKTLDLWEKLRKVGNIIKNNNDEELKVIHEAYLNDPETKPREIVETSNLSIDEVKNAKKRYIRLVKRFLTA